MSDRLGRSGRRSRDAQAGFTLVELLVGLVVLSLIMAGLLAALRSFSVTGERLDQRMRQEDDDRVVLMFLREVVARAQPVPKGEAGQRQLRFSGAAGELEWIGVMPVRHGIGGLYRLRLSAVPDGFADVSGLVLDFVPFDAAGDDFAWDSASRRTLFPAVDGLTLKYEDPKAPPLDRWLNDWPHVDRLPLRIRVEIERSGVPLPPLLISILGRPDEAANGGAFVIGGGGK